MKPFLITIAIGAVVGIALLVWREVHDASSLDIRTEASRSEAVVYGAVQEDSGVRNLRVEEIWKSPVAETELRVGSVVAVPQLPQDAHPKRIVAFLERSSRDGRLHAGTLVAVYDGRLSWPKMSLEEAKAICAGTHASNQAMERTPTRRRLAFSMATTSSLRSTLALGGRRSSYSR